MHDPASAFKRGEGETLDRIEARLTPIKAFRPYAGKPTDEQLRCGRLPYVSARTGTTFRKPTLIVHRSLASEALEYYKPVEDFLSRHRHEVLCGPVQIDDPDTDSDAPDMLLPSEFTMYRLLDYDEAV
ncbi:hypothetical protein D2F00_11985 [Mycobacteroides abscessus]|nr:hypothetical protein [Mycobacteroides abscessus subsp. abscessus]RIT97608.1 hypothetical protein D2F00_11985 [Mycobacteroides abscessus]